MTPPSTPRPRPTARVLLVDEADRLLLLSSRAEPDGPTRWYAVGGGVEPGESLREAALREVREETGLTDLELSEEIWTGRPWVATLDGQVYEVHQHYFFARVTCFDVDTSGFEELERALVTGHRWWTLGELRTTTDVLRPNGLPVLFQRLLAEGAPRRPLLVDG